MDGLSHGECRISAFLILGCLVLASGCTGLTGGNTPVTLPGAVTTPPGNPASLPHSSPAITPARTPVDLSRPPDTAIPLAPSVLPIVGTWYASPPDDLTFEFRPDGTFTESSPNFRTFQGTWSISEEEEGDFYDAVILDRWGFQKPVHLLVSTGTLHIKGMDPLHRIA
ncbi:MAG TPA: hypothetical protein VMB35_01540 [Methanomicrobiales archaeon]|nr:hypothetical protein [Methanomicrobiales archaeon]